MLPWSSLACLKVHRPQRETFAPWVVLPHVPGAWTCRKQYAEALEDVGLDEVTLEYLRAQVRAGCTLYIGTHLLR